MGAAGGGTVLGPVIVTNVGVLLVLLFGPNSTHFAPFAAYTGAAIAIGGVGFMVRNLLIRRRYGGRS